jgi:hypothetical protein
MKSGGVDLIGDNIAVGINIWMSVGKAGSDINLIRWNFYLGYAIKNVQETNLELDMNDTHQVLC